MTPGLTAGSIAAIVAVLASLPLRSPSDTLLNSASVALAGLLAGVVAGIIWQVVGRSDRRYAYFGGAWAVLFLPAALAVALIGQSQLDNFAAFALPLAAIVFVATGLLTVALPRYCPWLKWWGAAIAVGLAIAAGLSLVGQTDQESGELQLPPPSSRLAPPATAPYRAEYLAEYRAEHPGGAYSPYA